MKQINYQHYKQHEEVWLLLPWYVNGSLHETEHKAVQKHAEICIACKREIANQKLLLAKASQPEMLDIASVNSFSKLQQKIGNPKKSSQRPRSLKGQIASSFASNPFGFLRQKAYGPQALLVMLLMLIIPVIFSNHELKLLNSKSIENNFRTLSSRDNLPLSDNQIRLVFSDGIQPLQVKQLVEGVVHDPGLKGPDSSGIYTLTVNDTESIPELVIKLRNNSDVLFAESRQLVMPQDSHLGERN